MYDLVDRYLRRLDQELHKFKMELEADNRGITEFLEKRKSGTAVWWGTFHFTYPIFTGSLDLDLPNGSHSQKENRHIASHNRIADRDKERERRSVGYVVSTEINLHHSLLLFQKINVFFCIIVLLRFAEQVQWTVKAVHLVYLAWIKLGMGIFSQQHLIQ